MPQTSTWNFAGLAPQAPPPAATAFSFEGLTPAPSIPNEPFETGLPAASDRLSLLDFARGATSPRTIFQSARVPPGPAGREGGLPPAPPSPLRPLSPTDPLRTTFDPSQIGRPPVVQPVETKPDSPFLRRVADLGLTAIKGAVGLPESVVGLADIPTGGRVGKALESVGFRPQEARAILDTYLSEQQQRANLTVEQAEGVVDTAVAALSNPSTVAHAVLESLPLMAGGAGIARGLITRGVPAIAAAAAGEGAVSAGAAAEQTRQASETGTLSARQAALAASSGAATGALALFGGTLARRLGIVDVDTLLAAGVKNGPARTNLARAVVTGAVEEGFVEELPQSIQEQIHQNLAQGQPAWEGVDQAAVMGALAGAVMGGGAQVGAAMAQPARKGAPTAAVTPAVPQTAPSPAHVAAPVATAPETPAAETPPVAVAAPTPPPAGSAPAPSRTPVAGELTIVRAEPAVSGPRPPGPEFAPVGEEPPAVGPATPAPTDMLALIQEKLAKGEPLGTLERRQDFATRQAYDAGKRAREQAAEAPTAPLDFSGLTPLTGEPDAAATRIESGRDREEPVRTGAQRDQAAVEAARGDRPGERPATSVEGAPAAAEAETVAPPLQPGDPVEVTRPDGTIIRGTLFGRGKEAISIKTAEGKFVRAKPEDVQRVRARAETALDPWQLTRQQWIARLGPDEPRSRTYLAAHRNAVRDALAEGQPVPPEVRREYLQSAELAPTAATSPATPVASPDDIPIDRATDAFRWSSQVPEQRAEQIRKEYADHVNSLYAAVREHAETPEQQAVLDKAISEYKRMYRAKYLDWLASRGRTASWMVTGRSGFNVRKNEKALASEQRKAEALGEWDQRARARVFQAVRDARTPEQAGEDAFATLKRSIDRDLAVVKSIEEGGEYKGFDKAAFTRSAAGKLERLAASGDYPTVVRALAYIRERQQSLKRPFFAPGNKVWRLAEPPEPNAEMAQAESTERESPAGFTVREDVDENRLMLVFPGKPPEAVRQALRRSAFKWSPTRGAWVRQLTDAARSAVNRLEAELAPTAAVGVESTYETAPGRIEPGDRAPERPPAPDVGRPAPVSPASSPAQRRLENATSRGDIVAILYRDAQANGFTGDALAFHAILGPAIASADRLVSELRDIDTEQGPRALFEEIAANGGLRLDPNDPFHGEIAALWEQSSGGTSNARTKRGRAWTRRTPSADLGGVSQVLRQGSGLRLDAMAERLRQNPNFTDIIDPQTLLKAIEEADQAIRRGHDVTPSLVSALQGAVGVRLGTRWWAPDAPARLVETEPAREGDTSFDVEAFERVDVLDTGERQPRLPGDAGAVREVETATPAFKAPFALTPESAVTQPVQPKLTEETGTEGGSTETYGFVEPVSAGVVMARRLWQAHQARTQAARVPLAASSIADVEERWAASRGIQPPSIRQKAREALDALKKLARHFPEVDPSRSPTEAVALEVLLEQERAPKWAQAVAHDRIAAIVEGLAQNEADLLTRALALPDILKDAEAGLYDGRDLPFGYSDKAAVERDLESVTAAVARHEKVRDALKRREQFVSQLTQELVDAELLPASVLEDPRYYHRQVMAYMSAQDQAYVGATKGREVRQRRRGFQKGRVGGSDFNTRYVEAEFEWVAQALTELKTKATLEELKTLADRTAVLKGEAKRINLERLGAKLVEQYTRTGVRPSKDDTDLFDVADARMLAEDALKPFNQQLAFSIRGVLDALAAGEYTLPDRLREAAAELADAYADHKAEMAELDPEDRTPFDANHPLWWPLLSALVQQPSEAGKWAASIFKTIRQREDFIKESLGRDYIDRKDPEDLLTLAPEDHVTWQPKEGNHFFRVQSVDGRVLEQVVAGGRTLSAEDQRSMMAMGSPRETWIVPEWLARTLDQFGMRPEPAGPLGTLDRFWKVAIGTWKQQMLMFPGRVVRYNLNNASGDSDAAVAYAPAIFKRIPASASFLYHVTYGGVPKGTTQAQMDARMERLIALGVIDSGLTALEIPDINDLPGFRRLAESDPQTFMAWLVSLGPKYYHEARRATQYRENLLRLAAYDYMLTRGGTKTYAASNPARVDALRARAKNQEGKERLAALLARDLIGDYQAVSSFTQFMRSRTLPFFSFQEINFKRYVRLFGNTAREGATPGERAWLGAKLAGTSAGRMGLKWGVRFALVNAFMVSVVMWNKLFFPDEDEELRRRGRQQLHLILGRYEDGSIRSVRIEGAFADFLEWFGVGHYLADVEALIQKDVTIGEKLVDVVQATPNKIVQLWEPFTKQLFEQITKRRTFPNAFRPTPIRDRAEHLAGIAALDRIYATVTGKPSPPGNAASRLLFYRTDPGEAAYYDVRTQVAKWREAQGKQWGASDPTERSNALYYWKRAQQWGDADAAERWRKRYYALGGTAKGLGQSVQRSAPLGALGQDDRIRFRRQLRPKDLEMLKMAEAWYRRVYYQSGRRQAGR